MTIVARQWLPSAAVVPQERGPEFLGPVDGALWSDGSGFHRGFFSAFTVRARRDVWFHFPMPTLVQVGDKPLHLDNVSLLWETADGARLGWIVAQHGGMERIPLSERLQEPPSEPASFEPPELWRDHYPASARRLTSLKVRPRIALRYAIQICVMVSAGERDGLVRFYGAGVDFSDGDEPVC